MTHLGSGLITVDPDTQNGEEIDCPTGMSVIGGGIWNDSEDTGVNVNTSYPYDSDSDPDDIPNNGWGAFVNNASADPASFEVYAICAPVSSVS